MSESETEDVVVEEVEGVTVTKYFDEEEFHFPSMVLEFDSHRNEAVDIRVEERKPEGISIENVGFHPAHGADYWSIEGDTLVFEYELEANTEYRTVYALRTKGPEEARKMFAEPDVIEVNPPIPDAGAVEQAAGMTRSTNQSPYREEDDEPAAAVPDEHAMGEAIPSEADSEDSDIELDLEEPDAGSDVAPAGESVVEQLARELREGDAPDESLAFLEAQFGTTAESTGSIDARLAQVQEDVANLRSYSNALEDFLDEKGAAKDIIEEFEIRLEGFEADVDRIEESTGTLTDELNALRDDVSDFQGSLDSLSANYAELTDEVNSLRADIEETDEQLPDYDIDERFTELADELSELNNFVTSLKSAFD